MIASLFDKLHSYTSCQAILIGLLLFSLFSCDTRNGVDRAIVKEEMANRELKRLRLSDIIKGAEELSTRYFSLTNLESRATWRDSLGIQERTILPSEASQEEKELIEAFQYVIEQQLLLEDYTMESGVNILIYHPTTEADSLIVTQLQISKKTIVKML